MLIKNQRGGKKCERIIPAGNRKIDCEKILGALWGLDTDLRKLQERLEKIFSFDIQIEYDRNSRKEHKGHISGKVTEKISLEQVSDYLSSWKEVSDFGKKTEKMAEMLWAAEGISVQEPFLQLAGSETSLVSLAALAATMELLGFSTCRVSPLKEGMGIGKEGMIPSETILYILKESRLSMDFLPGEEENLTPGSVAFLSVFGETAKEIGVKSILDGASGISREEEDQGILRALVLGERWDGEEDDRERDQVQVLETNVDDCSGEQLGYAIECLMKAGALDASCFPIFMKKGRPAYMLQVICKKEKQKDLEDIIFRETTSIGLRRYEENRRILPRSFTEVQLKDGHKVKIKVCSHHGQKFYYPEYDTVKQVCLDTGRPYRNVYDEAAALAGGYGNDI